MTSRGLKRYDPETRRYKKWESPEDFYHRGTHGQGILPITGDGYPRFTASERRRLAYRNVHGLNPINLKEVSDWGVDGPKVCLSIVSRP